MRNLICIVCPAGCSLDVDEDETPQNNLSVTGNRCPRGITYAMEEIRSPKRVVTATVSVEGVQDSSCGIKRTASAARVPVKSSCPCPRENIPAMLNDIYKAKVSLPVKAGDVVIASWNNSGIDIIATRSIS